MTVLTAGCASWTAFIPKTEDISKKRQARTQEAVGRFDEQRSRAELEAAWGLFEQRDFDSSTETLMRFLDRSPDDVEARLLLAESLLAAGRASEGISYLEPAMALRPNDARLHHMMGLLMDVTGQSRDAAVFYRQATKLEPDNDVYTVSYQTAVGPGEASDDVAGERKAEESSKVQWTFIEESSPLPEPASATRNGYAAHPEMIGRARPAPAPLVVPESVAAGAERADRVRTMDSGEADGSSNRAARPSASELLAKGSSALLAGRKDLALAHFREAIALEPHDPQIPISAAVSALRHNHPDVAVTLLEPSREAFADSAAIRRILGTAYYRLGDYESSQVALHQALSLDKSSALSYFLMGCTLVKLGQPAVAETHFRQARTLDPRYALGR
ncbi:MAG: tetratricopeptide repeat protein [Planctomycetota bacterium]